MATGSHKVTVIIDDLELKVAPGEKVLWAALENDIYIPHLCAIKDISSPPAGCRLCFVEVEGKDYPVTSCTQEVADGMVVHTRSSRVDQLVKTAFELLLSDHRLDCANCPKNGMCALQHIARERGLKLKHKRFTPLDRELEVDESTETFALDRSRCVLCGQCVRADREIAGAGVIGFSGRGISRSISTFGGRSLAESSCFECARCVEACPVGALYYKQ